MKRRLCSTDDESFDSFKRRHIAHAKSETNSAAPQSSRGYRKDLLGLNDTDQVASAHSGVTHRTCVFAQGSSTSTLGKKGCQARAVSSKSGWEERLEKAFGAIHPDESNPGKKLVSSSHRELELTSSDGIRSPALSKTDVANSEKRKTFINNLQCIKPTLLARDQLKNGRSKPESSCIKKIKRPPWDINPLGWRNELFQLDGNGERMSPRNHKKRLSPLEPISRNHNGDKKRSDKKPKKLVPLSNLLISAKEYYELSILTPVALEREERYNWGHLKKNARVKKKLMRRKIRVLEMSSQAPAPSVEILERRFRAHRESAKQRAQLRPSCKPQSSTYTKLTEKHLGAPRPAVGAETANQREPALNNEHRQSSPQTQIPLISKYFPDPAENSRSFPFKSCSGRPPGPVSISPPENKGNPGPNSGSSNPTTFGPAIQSDTLIELSQPEIQFPASADVPLRHSKVKTSPVTNDSEAGRQNRGAPEEDKYKDAQGEEEFVAGVPTSNQISIQTRSGLSPLRDAIPFDIPSKKLPSSSRLLVEDSNRKNPEPESITQGPAGIHLKGGTENNFNRINPLPPAGSLKSGRKLVTFDPDAKDSRTDPVNSLKSKFQPILSDGFVSWDSEEYNNPPKTSNKCQIRPVNKLLRGNKMGSNEAGENSNSDCTDDSWPGFPWVNESPQDPGPSNKASGSSLGDMDILHGNVKIGQ
ncbi:uncharacterized protein PGTG_15887 [Puccinia graminis f. sp. tritici CRL 75-36-700-3]|uniref:Uncharacterized protein n=1 Tax=Puccinia graminis f. sp. tritici (strain CRL 75-36-700-3 / race SCCL) TaxID=418459 RepID=E3L0E1_PUCGT|nr:uncharacterized protein PGTG_15887 [Puccinia graminis f. sp. tritici CRL 75-36-700-3]EFP90039.1 hypothetical protein PGTG_15887 [Puccinia graminis f. sp. tritici CRL 75-36-700-3]